MRMSIMAVILSAGCTLPIVEPEQRAQPIAVPVSLPDATMAEVARTVMVAVNNARRSQGLQPLTADAALNGAARDHAEELAERRTLDHHSVDPERRTMVQRIEAAGGTWVRAAENLASMNGAASAVPDRVVRLWLDSDVHRDNMLSDAFTHTGVGVAIDRRGVWYITQLYVQPQPDR